MSKSRLTSGEWERICAQYQERTCTQKEFCQRLGIKPGSLSYHLAKHRQKPSFVPAKIEKSAPGAEIELSLPHGITLLLRSIS